MDQQLCQNEAANAEEGSNRGLSGPRSSAAASTKPGWSEGHPVVRSPERLRLHPAMHELDGIDMVDELNKAAEATAKAAVEPILIATDGTILAGFGRWRLAFFEGRRALNCIEYPLDENDSLRFILAHHQRRHGWNAFIRIRLALALEPTLQQRALANMRSGGKYKGSADLPKAQQIDVRQELAHAAAVGGRNVSNVKAILKTAHPKIIQAVQDGRLSINRAVQLCKLSKSQQLERFTQDCCDRVSNKSIRQAIGAHRGGLPLGATEVLNMLQEQEAREPGLVAVRVSKSQRTIILIGQDVLTRP
jgi:hypothetical protein